MTQIKNLFNPNRDIYKPIEKVITFDSTDEIALKKEVTEYIVTNNLRHNIQKLLDAISFGMESESNEVGIWVSGFYGSGKSSFAKNIGLAFDNELQVEGVLFRDRYANRINNLPISQQLKTLVEKYNPAIFLINLATKRLTLHGNILPPVSEVIYQQVMKWAGYAPEEKVAMLERKLEMDGRLDEFIKKVLKEKGEDWNKIKFEDVLTTKGIAQEFAPEFYPNIWKDSKSFNVMRIDSLEDESDKVKAMLHLIKKRTGRTNVLFIIDEVGNYIAAKPELIDHLAGTLENIKDIGKGKAWLLATAQQTLTEDNPNARFNSDKFFKLDARFPIKIDIEASDIKEITTQRLLGKSEEGAKKLKTLYAKSGEQLRLLTRLTKVEKTFYKSELDEKAFIDLYPFLPYQFDIILTLLAHLEKKTGGIGLRPAIRVVQDILTQKDKQVLLAESSIGALATAYNIYNVLSADIRKSYPHIASSVDKVIKIFNEDSLETQIAKSIALLQILDDFYLSVENLAIVMHPSVASHSILNDLRVKIDELKNNKSLTLKEIDGQLRFMTDAIIRIEDEKQKLYISGQDIRRILEKQIEELFAPVPSARILNTKTVKAGIQLIWDGRFSKILEPNEEIQIELLFSTKAKYDQKVNEIRNNSSERSNENKLYFIGALEENIDKVLEDIVRCENISGTKTRYTDKEIIEYLTSQYQEAQLLKQKVVKQLVVALENGEMLFRGSSKATSQLGDSLREAANAWVKSSAEKIYYNYYQVPLAVDPGTAQKLLQFDDLKTLPQSLKFFDAIKPDGGINTTIPAIQSIKDYLQAEGQVDGRKLLEHFMEPPFGWNRESTRYILSAMFLASEIKLRISGDWVKVKGPSSIEKLSSNQNINQIGISLYTEGQPTQEQILIAQKNLTELTGQVVPPLPQKISEVVVKHFPKLQTLYADLPLRLETLNLPGKEKADSIREGIEEILKGDASDATFRLGKENADLFINLKWAKSVYASIENGIDKIIKEVQNLREGVEELPSEGVINDLKILLSPIFTDLDKILSSENFFEKAPELSDYLMEIKNSIADTCEKFRTQENQNIQNEIDKIKEDYRWKKLNDEQKMEFSNRFEGALIGDKEGINGIREIINEIFSFGKLITSINLEIEECLKAAEPEPGTKKIKKISLTHLPKRIETKEDLDKIIEELKKLQGQISEDEILDLNW